MRSPTDEQAAGSSIQSQSARVGSRSGADVPRPIVADGAGCLRAAGGMKAEGTRVARDTPAAELVPDALFPAAQEATTIMPTLDWHRLQPSDIHVDHPGGTDSPDSTPPRRDVHAWDLAAAASVVAMQGVLIAACVSERYRRLRAEQAARVSGSALRTSDERNSDLVGQLISAQEAERTRIARDLHDDACQEAAAITLEVVNLRHEVRGLQDPDVQEMLLSVQRRIARIAESLRLLSHDLHPSLLQHVGLVAALEAHCAEAERHHHIHVTFRANGDVEPVGPDIVLALFRIAQEAIRNAARHGHAGQVTVSLARTGAVLELSITDDGAGFDVDGVREAGGLGLVSIEERARLVGGQVTICSQPRHGTTIAVRVPMALSELAVVNS